MGLYSKQQTIILLVVIIAFIAYTAFWGWRTGTISAAYILHLAGNPVYTGIIGIVGITTFKVKCMFFDFFGNGGSVLAKFSSYSTKGFVFTKTFFNYQSIFKS